MWDMIFDQTIPNNFHLWIKSMYRPPFYIRLRNLRFGLTSLRCHCSIESSPALSRATTFHLWISCVDHHSTFIHTTFTLGQDLSNTIHLLNRVLPVLRCRCSIKSPPALLTATAPSCGFSRASSKLEPSSDTNCCVHRHMG